MALRASVAVKVNAVVAVRGAANVIAAVPDCVLLISNDWLPAVIVSLEGIGDRIFTDMENASEISAGKTTVDTDSDLLIAKELKVSFNVQPTGVLGFLNGTINLKSSING